VFSRLVFWPWLAGVTVLVIGLAAMRREFSTARRLDKLIVLGRPFFASSLAVFGAEHFTAAKAVMQFVPPWMPARLFWAYFVGVALLAAAISIVLMQYVRLSALLLGVMFFLFVSLIHLPNVAANPRDRIMWAIALRDLAFGGGAVALAANQMKDGIGRRWLITVACVCIGVPAIFFGVEHFLHPEFAPGVPLGKVTPTWIPFPSVWGYLTGAVLLAAGAAILVRKQARAAATWIGVVVTLLVLFIYLPILARATQISQVLEAVNYVADTLLFAGTALLLAESLPKSAAPL
jgi:uncharacterized membrane protein